MAETPPNVKRLRQDTEIPNLEESNSKRHKPYNSILSLLDDEEETLEQNEELSAIFTSLEQELSFSNAADFDFESPPPAAEDRHHAAKEDEGVKSVMRHLREASDDELGIPNYSSEENNNVDSGIIKSDENISFNFFDNGVWEFDDVAANYSTILQSELFM